jgi:hypothetical protein
MDDQLIKEMRSCHPWTQCTALLLRCCWYCGNDCVIAHCNDASLQLVPLLCTGPKLPAAAIHPLLCQPLTPSEPLVPPCCCSPLPVSHPAPCAPLLLLTPCSVPPCPPVPHCSSLPLAV